MPDYYIDFGTLDDGLFLSAKVTAKSRDEAVEALKEMLYYRFGKGDDCGFMADGGRLGNSEAEVGDVFVWINPECITTADIVDEEGDEDGYEEGEGPVLR